MKTEWHGLPKLHGVFARKSLRDRFEASYSPEPMSGCWLWLGVEEGSYGYGRIRAWGRGRQAHVVSLILSGVDVPYGSIVLHSCDNPSCVNPSHLRVGTTIENNKDMVRKGRQSKGVNHSLAIIPTTARGDRNSATKLSEEAVRKIRGSGESQRKLAAEYGVSQKAINLIKSNRSWKWLK